SAPRRSSCSRSSSRSCSTPCARVGASTGGSCSDRCSWRWCCSPRAGCSASLPTRATPCGPRGRSPSRRCTRRAAMADPLLRTENLSKSFGGVIATDNLNLAVTDGEAHAVIGPNGAGKTTLIAQLAGELAPSAGRIWFDGRDVTDLPAHARVHIGIARSFQITSLLPSFTVAENVQVALRSRRGHSFVFLRDAAADPELADEVHALLELVG